MDTNAIPCYGRLDKVLFLATHSPITPACHRRAMRAAMAQETYGSCHDVLVEDNADGTVMMLPADAMPAVWRTLWRRRP